MGVAAAHPVCGQMARLDMACGKLPPTPGRCGRAHLARLSSRRRARCSRSTLLSATCSRCRCLRGSVGCGYLHPRAACPLREVWCDAVWAMLMTTASHWLPTTFLGDEASSPLPRSGPSLPRIAKSEGIRFHHPTRPPHLHTLAHYTHALLPCYLPCVAMPARWHTTRCAAGGTTGVSA